jgi:hypothetical protein
VVKEFYVLSVGKCQLDASLSVCYQQKWHPSFSLSLSLFLIFSLSLFRSPIFIDG